MAISNKNRRIVSLDLLRGVAALSVMLFHYTIEESIHLSDDNILRIIGRYGHYGVEVFFVISGFIIPYSMFQSGFNKYQFKGFLLKRCIRIEIPYFAIILLEVLLIYISSLTPWRVGVSERLDIANLVLHISYLNGFLGEPWLLPIFWTLAIEFQFYILMAIIYKLLTSQNQIHRIGTIIFLAGLSTLIDETYLFFHYSLYFTLGIILFQFKAKIIEQKQYFFLTLLIVVGIGLQSGWLVALVCLVTIVIINSLNREWKLASTIGLISYSVYLIHIPFGGRLLFLTQKFVGNESIKSLLIVLYLFVTIVIAWVFYRLVEKPSQKLSKEFGHKYRPSEKVILSGSYGKTSMQN